MTIEANAVGRGTAFGLLASLIWGGYMVLTRQAVGTGLRPADLVFLRFAGAGLIFLPWLLRHAPLTLVTTGWIRGPILAALAGPPFVLLVAGGYTFAPLADGAVFQLGSATIVGVLLAIFVLGERSGPFRLIGVGIVLAGLILTAAPTHAGRTLHAATGDIMFVVAGTMWAVFATLVRKWRIPAIEATAIVASLSGIVYGTGYALFVGFDRLLAAPSLILVKQGIMQGPLGGALAVFAFSRAVELLGSGRAALFPALAPPVAILIGIPVLGEYPNASQWLGLFVGSIGLMIVIRDGIAPMRQCPV